MKLLAIDTSTDFLSLAIMDKDKMIGRLHREAARNHSRLLVPMIDRMLKKAKLGLKDIDGFCISIGPGSFTGLRIGVATVKGLAYSLKKRIIVVPTLDAIAENAKGFNGVIVPVLDARKNKVYAAIYKSDGAQIKRISKYLLVPAADLLKKIRKTKDKILFLGDGMQQLFRGDIERAPKFLHGGWGDMKQPYLLRRRFEKPPMKNLGCSMAGPIKSCEDWHPKAENVARLGLAKFKRRQFTSPEDLEPLYLYSRECDITGI